MLTGRSIVCGATTFLYYHGVDYSERYNSVKQMYEEPEQYFTQYAEKYGIDYVLIAEYEHGGYNVNTQYFERFKLVYSQNGAKLYKVSGN